MTYFRHAFLLPVGEVYAVLGETGEAELLDWFIQEFPDTTLAWIDDDYVLLTNSDSDATKIKLIF